MVILGWFIILLTTLDDILSKKPSSSSGIPIAISQLAMVKLEGFFRLKSWYLAGIEWGYTLWLFNIAMENPS